MAEPWNEVTLAGVRWLVRPAWQPFLLGEAGLRWADWQAERRVQVVKKAPHRTVFRVALAPGAVFVKHYPTGEWRAKLRQMVRPSKARMELERTLAAAARALPTIDPVAIGENGGQESYLITAEWADAEPADRFLQRHADAWSDSAQASQRRRFTHQLAVLLARLHEAGLRHRDLHAGNLMVRPDAAGDGWEITLIDLYAAEVGPPLAVEESLANLALFGNWFWPRTTPADRLRFWRTYLAHRRTLRNDSRGRQKELPRALEEAVWERHCAVWLSRSGRCLGVNREFQRLKCGAMAGGAIAGLPREHLEGWLLAPEVALQSVRSTSLKQSRSSQVVRLPLGEQSIVYKRFAVTKRLEPFTQTLAGSPARRAWHAAFLLLEAGIPTARPLAYFERRRFGLVHDSYLVSEYLSGAQGLKAHLAKQNPDVRTEARRKLADQAARLLRRLHRYGLSHRDLKADNWLVVPGPEPTLHLIDLVGVERQSDLCERRKAQNLARFAVSFLGDAHCSRTDRLRFLKRYLHPHGTARHHWKAWWRRIEREVAAKTAKNRRTGRPLS